MGIALLIWGFVQRGFSSVIQFLSTPLGMRIAAALGLVLGFWWWGHHQYIAGVSHCETQHAEAAANELARQKTVFIDADKKAEVRAVESEKKNTESKKVVADVKQMAAIQPQASDMCISADIADKLREQN